MPTVEGKTVKEWMAGLDEKLQRKQPEAAEALGAFGPHAEEALPALLEAASEKPGFAAQDEARAAIIAWLCISNEILK